MEGLPGFLVDLGFERRPKGFVRVAGAQEVGVTDEEALFIIVGVDEPAGDAIGAVATDLAGVGMEYIHAVDLDLDVTVFRIEDVDVWFAKDDEKIAFTGILEVVGHVEVGVHAGLENRNAAEFVELRGVGVVVEGAGDQHVEVSVCSFTHRGYEIGTGDGAEFRTYEDASAFLSARVAVAIDVGSFGADEVSRPWSDSGEGYVVFFVRLLDAGCL